MATPEVLRIVRDINKKHLQRTDDKLESNIKRDKKTITSSSFPIHSVLSTNSCFFREYNCANYFISLPHFFLYVYLHFLIMHEDF